MSRLRCPSLGLKPTIGRESVGATFQLGGKFGAGRSGGIPNAILISLTSEVKGRVLVSCLADRDGEAVDGEIELRPHEGLVIALA